MPALRVQTPQVFGFASIALDEHGVVIAGAQSVQSGQLFGRALPLPCNDIVQALTFMLKPLPPTEAGAARTNFTFTVKVDFGVAEGTWLDMIGKVLFRQIGSLLQSRIEAIIAKFDTSPYAQRVHQNPDFYNYLDAVVQEYLSRREAAPPADGAFDFPLPVAARRPPETPGVDPPAPAAPAPPQTGGCRQWEL